MLLPNLKLNGTNDNQCLSEWLKYYYAIGIECFPIYIKKVVRKGKIKKDATLPKNWSKRTFTIEDALKMLESGKKYNGIAGKMGKKSRILAVDHDIGDDVTGEESLKKIGIKLPSDAPRTKSPSGGYHKFLKFPMDFTGTTTRSFEELKLDTRGEGGLIFLPPTSIPDYGSYEWENPINGPLPETPKALLDFLKYSKNSPSEAIGNKKPKGIKISKKQENVFKSLLKKCETARIGKRSEPDFAVIAYGIESNIPKEYLKELVKGVGRWKEESEKGTFDRYFETTYKSALNKLSREAKEKTIDDLELTDVGNADIFEKYFGDQVRPIFYSLKK